MKIVSLNRVLNLLTGRVTPGQQTSGVRAGVGSSGFSRCFTPSAGVLAILLLGAMICARAADQPKHITVVTDSSAEADASIVSDDAVAVHVHSGHGDGESRQVAWLGVGADEVPEALASQLGLNHGEGLVATMVASNSPAAKAGLQKHDVLVEIDGQLLVHPAQLRKLVRAHKEGDNIKITYYRAGKKDSVTATLGKTKDSVSLFEWNGGDLNGKLGNLKIELDNMDGLKDGMKAMKDALAQAGLDKEKLNMEIRKEVEQANKAFADAMRSWTNSRKSYDEASAKMLHDLARQGLEVSRGATVTIRNRHNSATISKSDETGSYVIIANPKKRLIAHDQHGKMIFEGEIETPEQQAKLPEGLWEKVKPLVESLGSTSDKDAEPEEPAAGSKKEKDED
jgi:hypothetical protein